MNNDVVKARQQGMSYTTIAHTYSLKVAEVKEILAEAAKAGMLSGAALKRECALMKGRNTGDEAVSILDTKFNYVPEKGCYAVTIGAIPDELGLIEKSLIDALINGGSNDKVSKLNETILQYYRPWNSGAPGTHVTLTQAYKYYVWMVCKDREQDLLSYHQFVSLTNIYCSLQISRLTTPPCDPKTGGEIMTSLSLPLSLRDVKLRCDGINRYKMNDIIKRRTNWSDVDRLSTSMVYGLAYDEATYTRLYSCFKTMSNNTVSLNMVMDAAIEKVNDPVEESVKEPVKESVKEPVAKGNTSKSEKLERKKARKGKKEIRQKFDIGQLRNELVKSKVKPAEQKVTEPESTKEESEEVSTSTNSAKNKFKRVGNYPKEVEVILCSGRHDIEGVIGRQLPAIFSTLSENELFDFAMMERRVKEWTKSHLVWEEGGTSQSLVVYTTGYNPLNMSVVKVLHSVGAGLICKYYDATNDRYVSHRVFTPNKEYLGVSFGCTDAKHVFFDYSKTETKLWHVIRKSDQGTEEYFSYKKGLIERLTKEFLTEFESCVNSSCEVTVLSHDSTDDEGTQEFHHFQNRSFLRC